MAPQPESEVSRVMAKKKAASSLGVHISRQWAKEGMMGPTGGDLSDICHNSDNLTNKIEPDGENEAENSRRRGEERRAGEKKKEERGVRGRRGGGSV